MTKHIVVDVNAPESLEEAWNDLENGTRSPVREISYDDSPQIAPCQSNKLDPRTIFRWEDDGGSLPIGWRRAPC